MRCLKFGVTCDGYDSSFRGTKIGTKTYKPSSTREILPRTSHNLALVTSSLERPPSTAFFQDEREHKAFLHFQEEATIDLSGAFDASLWNHVILQACQNEPSLRRLTASIGALNKAKKLRALNKFVKYYERDAISHEQYALRQYGRALQGVQEMISKSRGRDAARTALIAALLIFCFENLTGEIDSAIAHMETALQLMHKQLSQASRRYRHIRHISPTPALDDELVAAFVRLDTHLMSRIDEPEHKTVKSCVVRTTVLDIRYSEDIFDVPDRFRNFSEARIYLEHCQFSVLPQLSGDFVLKMNESPDSPEEFAKAVYEEMTAQLRQWRTAFAPLFTKACTPGSKDFVAAATLRIQDLSSDIALQRICANANTMNPSEIFVPESREILTLSKQVLTDPSFRKTFVFDCGVLPGLFIVLFTCLDMRLRKEALQVLREMVPRREGVWDSLTIVRMGERVLQMEEKGEDCETTDLSGIHGDPGVYWLH